ncbi:MAG: hypothetical protein KDC49_08545 [Saprospiraceae bacterium]|nr:hypothetical protein [Saprospiraceae bacterium]
MFQEPNNYIEDDHFFFEADKELEMVCNAPKDKNGVFKVIELRHGRVNLVYIGYSNSGGLFDEIVNGRHFDKNPRKTGWTYQMIKDGTDALDIYWYVLADNESTKKAQVDMLQGFLDQTGKLPKWNK